MSVDGVYVFTLYVGYCDGDCTTDIYTQRDQMDFTVNLIDPCKTEAISVDSAVLTNLVIAYHIYNPPDLQALSFDSIDRSV